jgi:hypothetical protein
MSVLKVLTISSAGCVRGFSQTNLYNTSRKTRLLVATANDLLIIGINGPLLKKVECTEVTYFLAQVRQARGALDKALPKRVEISRHNSKLFA